MSANTTPIFVGTPRSAGLTTGTSANTNLDGTGSVVSVFTADATNGSFISKVRLTHLGTNVATVVRLFVNNGSTNATAANNTLVAEVAMAANTLSQTAISVQQVLNMDLILPAGFKLNATIGTAIAAGIMVQAEGGNF